jgi:hypothetical protein
MNQAGRAGPSISTDDHRGWLNLWAADVPGKVKIHVWRLIKNGLAVGDELHRRNIKHGVRCVACYQDESTQILEVSAFHADLGGCHVSNESIATSTS